MDNKMLAKEILQLLGGKENVVTNAACMTRLRVGIREMKRVNLEDLKKLEDVMGVVESETLQIVLGPGKVNRILTEFSKLTGLHAGADTNDLSQVADQNKQAQKEKYDKPLQKFLKKVANIFVPLLPGIIAAGLINGLANVINVSTDGAFSGLWWYETIRTVGWALFMFLPLLVGHHAAKEFGGSAVLGAIAGAMFISHPSMPLLTLFNEQNVMLPFTNAVFNPAAGGLIAALIAGMFIATLERNIRKIMPDLLDTFLTPLLTLVIGGLAAVLILQPLGSFVTSGIFGTLNFVYERLGMAGGYILSAGFLPLVALGLHQALTPIHALLNDPTGPTLGVNYLLPILMMAGGGQIGAGFALYLKTRNAKLKRFIRDALPVGLLGVGEPLMYAVTLPLGKSFLTACLGAGIGGVLASLLGLGAISQGVSGLFGLLLMKPGQQFSFIIAMLGAYAGGFLLTYFFGVDEDRINEVYGKE